MRGALCSVRVAPWDVVFGWCSIAQFIASSRFVAMTGVVVSTEFGASTAVVVSTGFAVSTAVVAPIGTGSVEGRAIRRGYRCFAQRSRPHTDTDRHLTPRETSNEWVQFMCGRLPKPSRGVLITLLG